MFLPRRFAWVLRTDTFQPIELTAVEIARLPIDQLGCSGELIRALLERDLQDRRTFLVRPGRKRKVNNDNTTFDILRLTLSLLADGVDV